MKRYFATLAMDESRASRSFVLSSGSKCRFLCPLFVFFLSAVMASSAQTLTTLAPFNGANGADPAFGYLIQASDGNFYGTTLYGGANNGCDDGDGNGCGTVFKVTPTGGPITLYSFCAQNNCTDGAYPAAGLVQGTDGNFYGTTSVGGTNSQGTVFKITPAGNLTTLYSFCSLSGCADGDGPYAGLVQGTDGNFYGTTSAGGTSGGGTVFNITPAGNLTTLYTFCSLSGCTDGLEPFAGLVQGTDGNFYGTTIGGGPNDGGTVFNITPAGNLITLYSFCSLGDCADGEEPSAGVVQGADGNFYGTTIVGGTNEAGTIFGITPAGTLIWVYSFCSLDGCSDGEEPYAGLVQATDGSFYGTTITGGANEAGTIFTITPTGSNLTTLYSFCSLSGCTDGAAPFAGLVQGTDGNFYGTTFEGGTGAEGTVYSLSLTTTDYTLTVSTSGSGTVTSTDGFISCPGTCSHLYLPGTPVTLNATPNSGWTFTGWTGACNGTGPCNITMNQNVSVGATFSQQNYVLTASTSGSGSVASTDGNISCPGVCGYSYPVGAPVTLNATPAQGWSFTGWSGACSGTGPCNVTMTQDLQVIATFAQNAGFYNLAVATSGAGTVTSTDGFISCPGTCSYTYANNAQVTLNATATQGGTFIGWSGACSGSGACNLTMTQNLAATASFSVPQQETLTHNFGSGNDGQEPLASLVSDATGNLYGTTSMGGLNGMGTVFEVSPSGAETVLHSFGNGTDGQQPLGNLIFDGAGNLYGTTYAGGSYGNGTVFELSPNGTETVLYNFGNGADGRNPSAGLVFDASGNLYGTTSGGGIYSFGTAFELSPNGQGGWTELVVYSFGNGSDGRNPSSGLIFDGSGNLYGTTQSGGQYGGGIAFELSPNGSGCCRENPLYSFGNGTDGSNPSGGLIFDASGNLYGTTQNGGAYGYGLAFELSPSGSGCCRENPLYSFGNGSDGRNPLAGLIFDGLGNLYGTTQNGGLYGGGLAFELSPNGSGCCRENPLYSFGNGNDGSNPAAGLIFDGSGNLHGTAQNGGLYSSGGVFQITPGPLPVQFIPATPCRVVDTRNPTGTFGGPAIPGGTARSFPLEQGGNPCGIPSNAIAYSLNVTVVPQTRLGYLTIWPTGDAQPLVSTLNSPDGRVKANAAIVPVGTPTGAVSVYVTDTTNAILDIDGYFTAPGSQTLQFYPLTPCRVVDTRQTNFPQGLGSPSFGNMETRELPVLTNSPCLQGLPNTPQAYSFNVTVVPHPSGQPLSYLTIWPSNQTQPLVSTLNNRTATVVANAAIVPSDPANGDVSVFTYNSTDVIIDTNGYFAAPGQNGYSFYPVTPCRAYDSRNNNGQPFQGKRVVNVAGSACATPANAVGYVFNATVVPPGPMPYLTLWPDGQSQPVVSTLNAYDGFITSNMAIVPTGPVNPGSIDAYAAGLTQLILDISGYFAP
jgi:uncharacterized repeat protein (TIGR02543 family)